MQGISLFETIFLSNQHTLGDQQHTRTIRSACWSPDGQFLATVGFDSQMCIYLKKENDFECVAVMDGHENEVIEIENIKY